MHFDASFILVTSLRVAHIQHINVMVTMLIVEVTSPQITTRIYLLGHIRKQKGQTSMFLHFVISRGFSFLM